MNKNNDILKMKIASTDEINLKILELRRDLMKARFNLSSGQLKNTSAIKVLRKNIARLLTYLKLNNLKK